MIALVGPVFWLALAVASAGILHMVAVKLDIWKPLKRPLDGGRTWRGKRIFGPNKTWRGVVFMIAASAAVGAAQGALGGPWAHDSGVALLDFQGTVGLDGRWGHLLGYAWVNAFFGLGYALGELPNSFVKRQLDIEAGKTSHGLLGALFLVVDQGDSVVAALLLGQLVFGFGWDAVLVGSVCLTGLHLAINLALYLTKVRKNL